MVRRAKPEDLGELAAMWSACLAEENETCAHPQYPAVLEVDAAASFVMSARNPDAVVFVAEDAGKVVGYLAGGVRERILGAPYRYAFVETLYVKPQWRKKFGLAEELVNALRHWLNSKGGVSFAETMVRPGEKNLNRWVKKGWIPFAIHLFKPIEEELNL